MAADIRRYLNDEPIVARRPSTSYQLQKFARRHNALWWQASPRCSSFSSRDHVAVSISLAEQAMRERDRANLNGLAETRARVRETEQRKLAETARVEADAARVEADAQRDAAQQEFGKSQANLYHKNIDLADREWQASNIAHSDRLLDEAPVALRNWEWNYLARRNHMENAVLAGHRTAIIAMSLDGDGNRLRTIGADSTFKDWDLNARKETATGMFGGRMPYNKIRGGVLSTDGRFLLTPYGFTTAEGVFSPRQGVWDLSPGKALSPVLFLSPANSAPDPDDYRFRPMTMTPDGRRVVGVTESYTNGSRQSTIRTWDIDSIHASRSLSVYPGWIQSLTYSPTGDKVAVVRRNSSIEHSWTAPLARNLPYSRMREVSIEQCGVQSRQRNSCRLLIPGDWHTGVECCADGNGTLVDSRLGPSQWQSRVQSGLADLIADSAFGDRTIRLLDSATGHEGLSRPIGHAGAIRALCFTPDGKQLVAAGDDKLVRIWDLRSVLFRVRILDVGRSRFACARSVRTTGRC